ncbi:nucleotidyl transferase AbiEii/AbiGii toxin family protein [Pseudothauera nasutitermitis]|uniref:nucleotidyl transferase AbiEii/AbiGii toxin family protein n=1 Tax=Pseudothauera nasutitermitis TaxID=2565930 RepID=UPI001B3B2694|nr:nucleotidyl transferase AbiEii/AbiGii toxin family protein [Pseudothauera nasutitermitis]
MNPVYLDTARLLTQVAPLVFVDDTFALKGGTAINLFVRDMPRLSVDLDLVFPDHTLPRDEALARINEAVRQAAERLKKRGFQTHTAAAAAGETIKAVSRSLVDDAGFAGCHPSNGPPQAPQGGSNPRSGGAWGLFLSGQKQANRSGFLLPLPRGA